MNINSHIERKRTNLVMEKLEVCSGKCDMKKNQRAMQKYSHRIEHICCLSFILNKQFQFSFYSRD